MDGETCLWLAAHQNLTPLSAPTRSAGSSFDSRVPAFALERLWPTCALKVGDLVR